MRNRVSFLPTALLLVASISPGQAVAERPEPVPPGITLLPQSGTPAAVTSITTTRKKLFLGAVLANTGTKTVVAYRLAWRVGGPGQKPAVSLGDWIEVPGGIRPGNKARRQPPQQAQVPEPAFSPSSPPQGPVLFEFFVGAVRFEDGTVWEENLKKLKPRRPVPKAARRR